MFGRKSRWAGVNMLDLVPRARVSSHWDEENERIVLEVPRFREPVIGPWIQRLLPAHRKHFLVPLEDRGTLMWKLLDGRRTVGALAREVQQAFPEDREQVPERVSQYMVGLYQNKFIEFINL